MLWFWLSLGAAFFVATADYLVKRHFSDLPLGQMILVRVAGMLPLAAGLLFFVPRPELGPGFWPAVGLALPLELMATALYMKAIRTSPLALTMPFVALTPLLVVLTGYLVLGEEPTAAGGLAVALVVAGAYLLNLEAMRGGWLGPFRAVAREPGSRYMLMVAGLYSCTLVLGKEAILNSGPLFLAGFYPLLWGLALVLILAVRGGLGWDWLKRPGAALAVAGCMAAMGLCHYGAIALAPAAYMVAIKRLSALIAVFYGGVLLGEARLAQHLLAAGLMAGGAAMILLWG